MRRSRRAAALGALCVVVALITAAGGASRSENLAQLQTGDLFTVAHTHVLCLATVGKKVLAGKKLLGCSLVKGTKIVAKSYSAAVGSNGEIAIATVKPNGSAQTIIVRKPTVHSAVTAHAYRLQRGDLAYFSGTRIFCVTGKKGAVTLTCALYDVSRQRFSPGTWEFTISDGEVAFGKIDAAGKVKRVQYLRQPAV